MQQENKKIFLSFKAFTMLEVTVVMALSGLILLLAAGIFFILQGYLAEQSRSFRLTGEVMDLTWMLKNDMDNCSAVAYHHPFLDFSFPGDSVISYEFGDSLLIRYDKDITDSFNIRTSGFDIEYSGTGNEFIESVYFTVEVQDLELPVHVIRRYDPSFYYNSKK